jgi:paraquat-inducible protein B
MLAREWRSHGTEITIEFADGSGLEPGKTKLEYKGIAVGEIKEVRLAPELDHVIVRLQLARDAESIARTGSEFWVVQPEINFAGVSGLDTLLSGAHLNVRLGHGRPTTQFRGLDAAPAPRKVDEGRAFILQTERIGGLRVHAPVLYRDVKVGEVETIRLADDATGVWIRIRVQNPYIDLVHTTTRFWNAGGSPLQISLFGGGTQKRSLQSIITGAIGFATPEEPAATAAAGTHFTLFDQADDAWLKWSPHIPIQAPDTAPDESAQGKMVPGLLGG